MYLKIHNNTGEDQVVAVCDRELINTTLTCPACDIVIDPAFYGTELASDAEVIAALRDSVNANIIGKRVCELAINAGIVERETCIMIGDIPHVQIYRV